MGEDSLTLGDKYETLNIVKPLKFSKHSISKMEKRGTNESEVQEVVATGKRSATKSGRVQYEYTLEYNEEWSGKKYAMKQILVIVAEEAEYLEVVTVYTFYF
jgi:hypothetical protein